MNYTVFINELCGVNFIGRNEPYRFIIFMVHLYYSPTANTPPEITGNFTILTTHEQSVTMMYTVKDPDEDDISMFEVKVSSECLKCYLKHL